MVSRELSLLNITLKRSQLALLDSDSRVGLGWNLRPLPPGSKPDWSVLLLRKV